MTSDFERLAAVRGGGDLASGVALRLWRAGLQVVISELPEPLVVRRFAAFAEAVYRGIYTLEGVIARRVETSTQVKACLDAGELPVLVDPEGVRLAELHPAVVVDARMRKAPPEDLQSGARLVIGLGPGFTAGVDCQAVIETQRGHHLGRVIWEGAASADTGLPEAVGAQQQARVLRAPADGLLAAHAEIGEQLQAGAPVAEVAGQVVQAPFAGVLRGLLHPGLRVKAGMKIGDLDPRNEARYCWEVSDKALAIGGGVLEAILSVPELRRLLCG